MRQWVNLVVFLFPSLAFAGGPFNISLEAYASHGKAAGPIVKCLKTFDLPKSNIPWRLVSCNVQETSRNGAAYTGYNVRCLPSEEKVERLEVEAIADLNSGNHLDFGFVSFGSSTWIGVKADFCLVPWIDEEMLVNTPQRFNDHVHSVLSDFDKKYSAMLVSWKKHIKEIPLQIENEEMRLEAISALNYVAAHHFSFAGGYVGLLNESKKLFESFAKDDPALLQVIQDFQSDLERTILGFWEKDVKAACEIRGIDPREVFAGRGLECPKSSELTEFIAGLDSRSGSMKFCTIL